MQMGLVIIGVDHCTAPASLVERIRECEPSWHEVAEQLCRNQEGNEALCYCLPTRTELIVSTRDPIKAATTLLESLNQIIRLRMEEWQAFYRHLDEAAVAHLLTLAAAPDGEQAAAQLHLCCEQAQRAGRASRVLRDLTQEVAAHAHAVRVNRSATVQTTPAAVRQMWRRLQAQACVPAWAVLRSEMEAICAEEIALFRRSCGGLMTDDQERAVKIVTARISERVGDWMIRAWKDPAVSGTSRQGGKNS